MKDTSEGKKAVKAGIGYTIGNILVKGISFISIPVFARLLSVSDFGIVNTFTAYTSILLIVIGLALHASLKNAYVDLKADINKYISSLTIIPIIFTVLCMLIAILSRNYLVVKLNLENAKVLYCLIMDSYCLSLITFYNSVLALEYKYKNYLIVSLTYSLLNILISVFFICYIFPNAKYMGRILGTLLSAMMVSIYILFEIYKKSAPKINKRYWVYGLKISLPIVPHGVSQILLSQFDRVMIRSIIGTKEAGLYSFAYTISTIYQVIANSVDTAWSQWFFTKMTEKKYREIRKVGNYYVAFLAIGIVMFMIISPELIILMGGKKYTQTRYVILPVLVAMFFAAVYNLPSAIEYYYKKTSLIAIGTIMAAILNVVLNIIFIQKYGYIAAAYTTVICYFLYLVIHLIFSYKIFGGMLYDIKNIIMWTSIVIIGMIVIQIFINFIWIRLLLFLALLMILGAFLIKNKQYVKKIIGYIKK